VFDRILDQVFVLCFSRITPSLLSSLSLSLSLSYSWSFFFQWIEPKFSSLDYHSSFSSLTFSTSSFLHLLPKMVIALSPILNRSPNRTFINPSSSLRRFLNSPLPNLWFFTPSLCKFLFFSSGILLIVFSFSIFPQKQSGIGPIGAGNTVSIDFCTSCSYKFAQTLPFIFQFSSNCLISSDHGVLIMFMLSFYVGF